MVRDTSPHHARASRAPVSDRFSRPGTRSCRTLTTASSPPERWLVVQTSAQLAPCALPPTGGTLHRRMPLRGLAPFPVRRCCGQGFRTLDSTVSLPVDASHRPCLAHSKVSELFEISRVRTERSCTRRQFGRIDFRAGQDFQGDRGARCWIDITYIHAFRLLALSRHSIPCEFKRDATWQNQTFADRRGLLGDAD